MKKVRRPVMTLLAVISVAVLFAVGPSYIDGVNTTLKRLELQSEARTCRDALETGLPPLTTVYCNGVIREYDIMIKAYKEGQHQRLIERAQEKG